VSGGGPRLRFAQRDALDGRSASQRHAMARERRRIPPPASRRRQRCAQGAENRNGEPDAIGGAISDRYILSSAPASLVIGPGGSGKTIASGKKAIVEAQRMRPGADGVRRYVLGTWRQKYVNVWKATIPSWWKLFPRDLPGSKWTGASPREAEHIIAFEDRWGACVLTNRFRAFGESADPEDVLGNEFTDCYLNEWPTLPEDLFIALVDRVGREPPREVSGRVGRFFGDGNAPDVLNYLYRDFYETQKPGHVLFSQPSGLSPKRRTSKRSVVSITSIPPR